MLEIVPGMALSTRGTVRRPVLGSTLAGAAARDNSLLLLRGITSTAGAIHNFHGGTIDAFANRCELALISMAESEQANGLITDTN